MRPMKRIKKRGKEDEDSFPSPGKGRVSDIIYIPCGEKTTSSRREKGLIILVFFFCLFFGLFLGLFLCLGNILTVS